MFKIELNFECMALIVNDCILARSCGTVPVNGRDLFPRISFGDDVVVEFFVLLPRLKLTKTMYTIQYSLRFATRYCSLSGLKTLQCVYVLGPTNNLRTLDLATAKVLAFLVKVALNLSGCDAELHTENIECFRAFPDYGERLPVVVVNEIPCGIARHIACDSIKMEWTHLILRASIYSTAEGTLQWPVGGETLTRGAYPTPSGWTPKTGVRSL